MRVTVTATVEVELQDNGRWRAWVPGAPEIVAWGRTREAAVYGIGVPTE